MNRVAGLNARYEAAASLQQHGIEVIVVADSAGGRLSAVIGQLLRVANDEGPEIWSDLIGAAKLLRWRRLTQPQPVPHNGALLYAVEGVKAQVRRLRGAVASEQLLSQCERAADGVAEVDSPVGQALLDSLSEVGTGCCVIAADSASRAAIADWISADVALVLTATELERSRPDVEQLYVLGPPRFFRSSLTSAPLAPSLSFLLPNWFSDRALSRSPISAYAEGAARLTTKVFKLGDDEEPTPGEDVPENAEAPDLAEYLPHPAWGQRRSPDREPGSDEVEARKLLLAGQRAIWLDDGERIRGLDPSQPAGERVTYIDVEHVTVGSYLLLRQGATERDALVAAALALLGSRAAAVQRTQKEWKSRLQSRLFQRGRASVVRELRRAGVQTPERARAWTSPQLVRPHSDSDFERLLVWLDLAIQPAFTHATMLRRALYQASADLREELEHAMSAADLALLERDGHLGIDAAAGGFRGLLATRVLAIAPHAEIVPRSDARIPFPDKAGQWLA